MVQNSKSLQAFLKTGAQQNPDQNFREWQLHGILMILNLLWPLCLDQCIFFLDVFICCIKKGNALGCFPQLRIGVVWQWTAVWITGGLMVSPLPHAHLACCQFYYI